MTTAPHLYSTESVSTDCKTGTSGVAALQTLTETLGMSLSGRQRTKGMILNKISLIGGRRPVVAIQKNILDGNYSPKQTFTEPRWLSWWGNDNDD